MFGFLKDKLKQAVKAFSKGAESDVKEEQVKDDRELEQAKEREAQLAKKAAQAKKPAAKPAPTSATKSVEKISQKPVPKPAEQAAEKPVQKPVEKTAAKPAPTPAAKPAPVPAAKPSAKPVEKPAEKPVHKPEPIVERKTAAPAKPVERKTAAPVPQAPVERKTAAKPAPAPAPAPEPAPQKKGFFSKLFGKKKDDDVQTAPVSEPVDEPVEVAEALSDVGRIDEELARTDEAIDEGIEELEEELREDEAIEEHVEVIAKPITRPAAKQAAVPKQDRAAATRAAREEPVDEEEPDEKPSGFFGKLKDAFTKKTLTPEKFDELFWELELAMLENNVAVDVIEKIKADLRDELTSGKVSRMGIEDMITSRLRQSVEELFDVETFDLVTRIREHRDDSPQQPFVCCMIGVNGSGKTTTLAKIVYHLQKEGLSVVVAASDTFRAAAIDQLQEHCDKLDVKLISQGYGADPAAVAFDAIKHAQAKDIDVVLVDTAGRLHSNTNLMAELEKVVRVAKPHLKIFVGEAITGNDCIEQAQVFNNLVGIDAIVLSKADIDEKGGAAISVSYVTGKPILYLGTGQTYDDLEVFDKEKIIAQLELD
jgi:fused signal recognition particle receptor